MLDCGFDQLRPFHPGKFSRQQPAVYFAIMLFYGRLNPPAGNVSSMSAKLKEDCSGGEKSSEMACQADSKAGVVHTLSIALYLMCIVISHWKAISFFSTIPLSLIFFPVL